MKKSSIISITALFILWGCSSTKKLEATAPFKLGEAYAQKWIIEENQKTGYEVIIPILSLENEAAALKNLYHKGKMMPIEIKLTEIGNVAIAEFGANGTENDTDNILAIETDKEPFPFDLTKTQAVISYVNNKKVRYYLINGIRQNLKVTYPNATAKKEW